MIENSLREYGAGRSILLDKHGRIIAGNKTAKNCGALWHGMGSAAASQTDGRPSSLGSRATAWIPGHRRRPQDAKQLAFIDFTAA